MAGPPVTWTGHVDGVKVTLADGTVKMCVDEIESRRGAEVPQEPRLDVLRLQGLAQERVVEQIYLSYRKVVGCRQ